MNTISMGKQLTELITMCYKSNRPVLLIGSHGIGKSEAMEQVAKEMDIGLLVRDLSLLEPPDLIGLPITKDGRTVYAPPAFLPRDGRGLFVIEELNRADRIMRAPCLQLMTARSLNDYVLPAGWLPVACVNPSEEGYDVDELDAALLSRFVKIHVKPDPGLWVEWARRHAVHPDIIRYIECDATAFDNPESCPRSWKYVSDVLKVADSEQTLASSLRAAVSGLVGEKRGAAFLAFREKSEEPLSAEDVLVRYGSRQTVVHHWILTGRLDVVRATMLEVQKHLQPKGHFQAVRTSKSRWRNFGHFLRDLPADLRNQAIEMLAERGYEIPSIVAGDKADAA
jgi:hypothetical protein